MKISLLCLALFCCVLPIMAQENLEPDDAPIIRGEAPRLFGRDYGRRLKPEIGKDVRIFTIIEGGLIPDFAVGLKTVKDGYRIFMTGAKRDGGLDHCEAPIDGALAGDIILAWDKVLREKRPRAGRPVGGMDLPFQHFGARLSSGLEMGRVWDTPPGSNPAQLGRIASGLVQICTGGRTQPIPKAMAEIKAAVRAIR